MSLSLSSFFWLRKNPFKQNINVLGCVQTVLPGYVLTNMLDGTTFIKSSWTVPNPKDYVEANFRTLGLESRTASFWYHKLMVCRDFSNVIELIVNSTLFGLNFSTAFVLRIDLFPHSPSFQFLRP